MQDGGETGMASVAAESGTVAPQSAHKHRVNNLIWESLQDAPTNPVAVFCECASPQCFQPVWLTPDEYERVRDTSSVRSPGRGGLASAGVRRRGRELGRRLAGLRE